MFTIGNERVALVTDTACDLSDEQLAQYDIHVVPLRIATSQGELRDRLDISQEQLYTILQEELPRTSLPFPEDVHAVYRQLHEEGATRVLHLSMSGNLSGTCNMVSMLAKETDSLAVDVFDSRTLSCGLGLLVLEAAELLSRGTPVDQVIERLDKLRKHQLGAFVVRTLDLLRKGGRIGLVEGVVGSLLKIRPVICVNEDGVYQTMGKSRGFSNALTLMQDAFFKRYQGRRVRVAIVHGSAPEEAASLLDAFRQHLDVADGFISPVSPALAIHTGPGLLGAIVQYAD